MGSDCLKNKGSNDLWPNHKGHCTANIPQNRAIDHVGQWNNRVASVISADVKIAHFTRDGNSKGLKIVEIKSTQ